MESIILKDITKENNKYAAHLESNVSVAKIAVTTKKSKEDIVIDARVEFAQNQITSDLIWFADGTGKAGSMLTFVPNSAATISDVYVSVSDSDVEVEKIELFLAEEVDLSKCYPLVKDYDLEKNYYLDSVTVYTPSNGYTQYSIYTSINGRDFEEAARKTTKDVCDQKKGECYNLNGREARIIRIYIEYNSGSSEAVIEKMEFEGKESGNPVAERPEIDIPEFAGCEFDISVSESDTFDEIYGIIERRVGKEYKSWFVFDLEENEYDFFEISDKENKICVKGNNGVSLATGLNYYLKYFCKANISQVGDFVSMPEKPVKVNEKIHKETRAKSRYAYNYCTLSYSMAFWGEKEWRNELDWLALNGVNLVLDATAQEEVWRRFLKEIGYPHDEIKKFIAGPAYYAWAYMANLSGFGGPVHDSWFESRTALARKNHLIMKKLGMKPVLQGYSGMVPTNINDYDKNAVVIPQGTWCSFERPYMLRTTDPCFKKYASAFYKAQKEVYGEYSNYFATDPFHEGGITLDMSPKEISREVLSAMLEDNSESVWIIQSWQKNPTSELLAGIEEIEDGKRHALILDLYAEKSPNYGKGNPENSSFGYEEEFNHTPWLFCMLNNFGGRLGLHGHLDNLAREIPKVFTSCKSVVGIGITPEASVNNPVLYDFFFESVWRNSVSDPSETINLEKWLSEYTLRRYGAASENANKAWSILKDTVYKAELNNIGQGAPENIANARPALVVNAASTWGNSAISYDKELLKKAGELLKADYDKLKRSHGYLYDLISLNLQILSNEIQEVHNRMSEAFSDSNEKDFIKYSEEFLKFIDDMDYEAGKSEYYCLNKWVNSALKLAENADSFTKRLYEINAKGIITTWGSYNQSETGGLHDYSNRQWSGLFSGFYKKRWEKWIENKKLELKGEEPKEINWFEWEWNWVRNESI